MAFVKNSQGVVINTDDSQYKAILAQRESQRTAASLSREVDTLKDELQDIKALLAQVLNRN